MAQRPLDFSQTINHLNWEFPHIFFIAHFIFSVSISSVKIISISADNDFSPLRKYILKRNLSIKYVRKYKIGRACINTTENTFKSVIS